MLVWQSADGGIVCYSRDDETRYKALEVARRGDRVDLCLDTEAEAPWTLQTSVPHLEWRINAYKGDWRVPAAGYRSLMAYVRPRAKPTDAQLWVGQISAVEYVDAATTAEALDGIAKRRPPARTLLYLPDWGAGPDPSKQLTEAGERLISRAHALGFYVAVPVRFGHADASWDRLERMSRHRVRAAVDGGRVPDGGGPIAMNPAAREWRAEVVRGLRRAFGGTCPDALVVLDAHDVANDGAGRVEKRTAAEGMVQLLRDVQGAFPAMVLAAEGVSELTWPYIRISRRPAPADGEGALLTDALFGSSILRFGP
jgi:hypothetical protein